MVEVFKTNVTDAKEAKFLQDKIHETFYHYCSNFDLDDCDKILRVECKTENIDTVGILILIKGFSHKIEILTDEIPITKPILTLP